MNVITKIAQSKEEARGMLNLGNFDLIVLDVSLEGDPEGGISLLRSIREEGNWVPACFYTDMNRDEICDKMGGFNCLSVIPKQASNEDLVSKVMGYLAIAAPAGREELQEMTSMVKAIKATFDKLQSKLG